MTRILTLRCPHCGKFQKYQPRAKSKKEKLLTGADFVGKRRKCIKCGKSFSVYKNMKNKNVVDFDGKGKLAFKYNGKLYFKTLEKPSKF